MEMSLAELHGWLFGDFILCQCGQPELVISKLKELLQQVENYERQTTPIPSCNTADEYLWMYLLDHFNLTEHGGSIGASWLTGTGSRILTALNKYSCEDIVGYIG